MKEVSPDARWESLLPPSAGVAHTPPKYPSFLPSLADGVPKMQHLSFNEARSRMTSDQLNALAAELEMATCPPVRVHLGGNRAGKTQSLNEDFNNARYFEGMSSGSYADHHQRMDVNHALHEPVRHRNHDTTYLIEALRVRVLEHSVYLEDRTGETPEYVRKLQAENVALKKAAVSLQRQHDNLRSELDNLSNDMAEMRSHLGL